MSKFFYTTLIFLCRIMFFSDNYPNGRIRKASLSGANLTVIVFNGLVHVPSLSIDTENKKLYWVDIIKDTAEVCNYDGSNRRVIVRYNMSPMSGIQFYKVIYYYYYYFPLLFNLKIKLLFNRKSLAQR